MLEIALMVKNNIKFKKWHYVTQTTNSIKLASMEYKTSKKNFLVQTLYTSNKNNNVNYN